jgi:predicted HD superfamily hydrolase involved in NAD metabolism
MDERQMEKDLESVLKPKRFRHTIGVKYTSVCMAMRWGEDLNKAACAGLLHDCAKYLSPEQLLAFCHENGLHVTEAEQANPGLLHGLVGACFARTRYGIEDEEILGAITWHTTGRPEMTLLEKIVFTADYIEPGRDQAPQLDVLRQLAFTDLDQAVLMILKQTLDYLRDEGEVIDPQTEVTYNYYYNMIKKEGKI